MAPSSSPRSAPEATRYDGVPAGLSTSPPSALPTSRSTAVTIASRSVPGSSSSPTASTRPSPRSASCAARAEVTNTACWCSKPPAGAWTIPRSRIRWARPPASSVIGSPTRAPAARARAASSTTWSGWVGSLPSTSSNGVSRALVHACPNCAVRACWTTGRPPGVSTCTGKLSSGMARATPGACSIERTRSGVNSPGWPAATTPAAPYRSTGARVWAIDVWTTMNAVIRAAPTVAITSAPMSVPVWRRSIRHAMPIIAGPPVRSWPAPPPAGWAAAAGRRYARRPGRSPRRRTTPRWGRG